MSFNGSGTFLINTAGQPVVSGTVISSTAFNALTADLATGLSTAITKDGQTTVTANIPMSTYKFTGLGVGSAATDSANLSQVQSTVTKLLTSVSGTDTITAVGAPVVAAYAAGQMFYFVATGDNTGAVTLNIDSLGAKAVTRDGSVALAAGDIKSGEVVVVVYDGTRFQVVSQLNSAGDARFANVSIASSLYVGGVSTFVGNAGFSANVSIASALSVGGVAAITGATTIGGNLTLNGGTANGVLYLNGSKVATSGAVLVFDGTNLGIGTSTPSSKLEISGALKATGTGATASANAAVVDYVAGSTARLISYGPNTSTPGAIQFVGLSSNASAGDIRATIDSSGNLGLGVTPSAWSTSGSYAALQIGAVGLYGRAAASNELYLTSNAFNSATGFKYIYTASATRYDQDTGKHIWYNAPSGTAGNAISFTQAMTLDASGNLGVGITSPSTKLDLKQSTDNAFSGVRIERSATATQYSVLSSAQGTTYLVGVDTANAGNNVLSFGNSGNGSTYNERARITSGGQFSVNTTSAGSQMNMFHDGATIAGFTIRNTDTGAATQNAILFERNTSIVGVITTTNTATAYVTSSDRRLKNNIAPADNAGSVIDAIEVVKHDWKVGGHTRYGMIAQDLHSVAPEAVFAGDDGEELEKAWGVDYSKLVPMLVKEIQSLRARVAQLETK